MNDQFQQGYASQVSPKFVSENVIKDASNKSISNPISRDEATESPNQSGINFLLGSNQTGIRKQSYLSAISYPSSGQPMKSFQVPNLKFSSLRASYQHPTFHSSPREELTMPITIETPEHNYSESYSRINPKFSQYYSADLSEGKKASTFQSKQDYSNQSKFRNKNFPRMLTFSALRDSQNHHPTEHTADFTQSQLYLDNDPYDEVGWLHKFREERYLKNPIKRIEEEEINQRAQNNVKILSQAAENNQKIKLIRYKETRRVENEIDYLDNKNIIEKMYQASMRSIQTLNNNY